ncbi:MAG: RNA polymerase sigma factor [Solirubrobacteraceae bacterium]
MRDDDVLIGEIDQGSIVAFEELHDRYCARAWRVALSACGDERRAADAVEQAFVSIWHDCGSYRVQHGTVAAWLLTAVRRRAVAAMRARSDGDPRLATKVPGALRALVHGRAQALALDRTQALRAFLDGIPDAQQEVIALALFGELTHEEIATCLGLSGESVKDRMRLGLHELAAHTKHVAPDASHEGALAGHSAQAVAQTRRRHPLGRWRSPPRRQPSGDSAKDAMTR